MDLEQILIEQQESLLDQWLEAVFHLYPEGSWRYLKKNKSFFTNPLGHTLAEGLRGLYAQLLEGTDADKLAPLLDQIIRVLAVQELAPSQALSFLYMLKRIVRGRAKEAGLTPGDDQLIGFDSLIDQLVRMSFDVYVKCREDLFKLQVQEQQIQTQSLIKLANNRFKADGQL
ncbi:MAG: RsbRD N-terminal domain-containing protein [bacterium]|nr:RsbRD N-terminal domain-containing protein [bacterium]